MVGNQSGNRKIDPFDVIYRLLLRAYPPQYRQRFGRSMEEAFRDLRRHERRRGGPIGVGRLWIRELWDLGRLSLRERLPRRPGRRIPKPATTKGRLGTIMETWIQDVRFGLRALVRQPLFCLVILVTAALGIGANTAIFSVVNGILLQPLPYENPDQIVMVWEDFRAQDGPAQEWIEVPNLFEWRQQNTVFEALSAFDYRSADLTGGDPERLTVGDVSDDFFTVFRTEPMLGRTFAPQDDRPGSARVGLLSHGFWQRRFGADLEMVGRSMTLDGEPYTIIGVLPSGFSTPLAPRVDVWSTLRINADSAPRGSFFLRGIGRIKDGVSLREAEAEMNTIMSRIGLEHPENEGVRIDLVPLLDQIVQPVRSILWILLGVVLAVLLIGCANIANLLLARGMARSREIAVRTAVGAGRSRLIRQLLTESLVLSLLGGGVALLLAFWGVQALVALAPAATPRLGEIGLDSNVLLFTLAVSILAGLFFGLFPALSASTLDVAGSLKGTASPNLRSTKSRIRDLLVIGETALALSLLVVSGLLVKSFLTLSDVDPGFRATDLTTAPILMPRSRYPGPEQQSQFLDQLIEGLESRPELRRVVAVSVLPLSGADTDTGFRIEGRPAPTKPREVPVAWDRRVTAGYFETMGIPILEGRGFDATDRRGAPPAAIISDVTAERFWPDENPIGKRIRFGPPSTPWINIVGVVKGVRHNGLSRAPRPELYVPFTQYPIGAMTLIVQSDAGTAAVGRLLGAELGRLDSEMPVPRIAEMIDLVDASVAQPRFFMSLAAGFAFVALVLSAIGIYGVTTFAVSRRTSEMGLRLALGAKRGDVLRMVLLQGLGLTAVGSATGLILAGWTASLLESVLFGVTWSDWPTYAAVTAILSVVALTACLVPAYRATRIDPLKALRYE